MAARRRERIFRVDASIGSQSSAVQAVDLKPHVSALRFAGDERRYHTLCAPLLFLCSIKVTA
jgi:hypothetical protein